jgi:hypothetical protein
MMELELFASYYALSLLPFINANEHTRSRRFQPINGMDRIDNHHARQPTFVLQIYGGTKSFIVTLVKIGRREEDSIRRTKQHHTLFFTFISPLYLLSHLIPKYA